jgi:hypothetical protein
MIPTWNPPPKKKNLNETRIYIIYNF